jgi:hypothetical protein
MPSYLEQRIFFYFTAACFLLALAAQAFAQPSGQPVQPEISDSELRAFVRAYVDNQQIRQQFEPTLQSNSDPAKEQQLQDQANAALKQSLARQNLTIDQYNRIYQRINSDEELRQKVLRMVDEERKKSESR